MPAATEKVFDLAFRRHAQELRDSWQARLLDRALRIHGAGIARPVDQMGAAVLSVLAHNFDDAMPVLLRIAHPGFQAIGVPFFCSAAKIAKTGHVMADLITKRGELVKNQAIFRNTAQMQSRFRRLADAARLSDAEREAFFAAARRWVVVDYRLDPTMNAADPDAKRLTVH